MILRSTLTLAVALLLAACGQGSTSPAPGASASPVATAAPASATPSGVPSTAGAGDPGATGVAFVSALATGDTATAESMEDDTMRGAAPAAALAQLWTQMVGQFGAFTGVGEPTTAEKAPYLNATVPTYFANATVPLIVTVDAAGRVAGFHIGQPGPAATPPGSPGPGSAPSPAPASPTPSPAAYVDPGSFTESEVTVGSAPWALPGTLSMPGGAGPFPAVVLLAGSGPNDRDETIGPNKPLRDLAWGLASQGIAVLRYDKRSQAHGPEMAANGASITVREEVTDDAAAAIDLLRSTRGVDPARVFVAGHSLGGYLAPRIALAATGKVAGIALLEAPTSGLEDMILAQYTYLASDAGGADARAASALPAIREQVARVKANPLSASTPASDLPLGIPAAYWLDLRGYDPASTARAAGVPVFISQGGRDYQVPPTELPPWREALAATPGTLISEYPAMNHLLMDGTGAARPAEYATPGHVNADLVADLARWVKGTGR